jgi:transcriptional regulator with GAF, ATPase, and Fis domain
MAAAGGTLFLDAIGELSLEAQAMLLRFFQNREIRRVGGDGPLRVDVRLIAATNRNLRRAIREGTFRRDLYHRLNVFVITLRPLRQRPDDIPILIDHFLTSWAREYGRAMVLRLTPAARRVLLAHP